MRELFTCFLFVVVVPCAHAHCTFPDEETKKAKKQRNKETKKEEKEETKQRKQRNKETETLGHARFKSVLEFVKEAPEHAENALFLPFANGSTPEQQKYYLR